MCRRFLIVKLRYTKAETLRKLLVPYFGPDTRLSADDKTNVLTLSDNPENLEKMLAVIRKIDVKPKDLVFTMQLIIASEAEGPIDAELSRFGAITLKPKLGSTGDFDPGSSDSCPLFFSSEE